IRPNLFRREQEEAHPPIRRNRRVKASNTAKLRPGGDRSAFSPDTSLPRLCLPNRPVRSSIASSTMLRRLKECPEKMPWSPKSPRRRQLKRRLFRSHAKSWTIGRIYEYLPRSHGSYSFE